MVEFVFPRAFLSVSIEWFCGCLQKWVIRASDIAFCL